MTLQQASAFYVQEAVATATPQRLLCLLFDRLARDIGQGRTALVEHRRADAEDRLDHGVTILTELLSTLDGTKWDGAGDLARIYAWMMSQLIGAKVSGDPAVLGDVHRMVMDLGAAWHGAADELEKKAS